MCRTGCNGSLTSGYILRRLGENEIAAATSSVTKIVIRATTARLERSLFRINFIRKIERKVVKMQKRRRVICILIQVSIHVCSYPNKNYQKKKFSYL